MLVRDTILTEYTGDTRSFDRAANHYDRTLARQGKLTDRRLGEMDRRWQRSRTSVLALRSSIAGLGAALGVQQVRAYGEAWRQVERSLTAINAAGAQNQQSMVDLALRTRTEIGATAAAVQRMEKSTEAGFEKSVRRVETLQKLLAVGGATGAERSSVSLQLGQALQSGVLSGDEFRSLRETAPVEFLDALAQAAGVTRAELKDTAAAQKLTSDIVLEALDSLADTADASFRRIAVSGDEAFATLSTGLTAYVGRLDEAAGVTASINGVMVSLGEYLSRSGEGAENLAAAMKLVAVAALAAAGGRGIAAMVAALQKSAVARRADVAAAEKQITIANVEQQKRRRDLDAANLRVRQLYAESAARAEVGKSVKRVSGQITRAEVAQEKAANALAGAARRRTVATNALTAAQARLSVATRLTAGAMGAFNATMAFFGGPIGLALTAISATMAVMATRTSELDRLTGGVTDRVSDLQAAYAAVGGQVDDLRQKMASTSLAQAITDAERLQEKLDEAREHAARLAVQPVYRNLLNKNPELGDLIAGLVNGRFRVDEFRAALNDLVADSDVAFARMLAIFDPVIEPLLKVQEGSERASDILAVLQGTSDEAAAAMKRLGITMDDATKSANDLGSAAHAASSGLAGLIAQVPELQKLAVNQERLAQAARDRNQALADLQGRNLPDGQRAAQEREILTVYGRAVQEITGVAEATRDADKALADYLDQSKIAGLDARGQALERERQRYEGIVAALGAANAGEAALASAREAHASNMAAIEARYKSQGRGGVSKASKADLRNLSALQELLIEGGQRQLYVEQALNAERQRMADLMPSLIAYGLSYAEAQSLIDEQLARVRDGLSEVKTESEKAAAAFAKGVLQDIRAAEDLNDAIGSIANRLLDLATDRVFDQIADQFARAFTAPESTGGGGWLTNIFSALFSGGGSGGANIAARANGGTLRKGQIYQVNENTPRSEIIVAPENGAVLNVQQAQAALRDASANAAQITVQPAGVALSIQVNNYTSAKVTASRGAGGGVEITIVEQLKSAVSGGMLDKPLKERYGFKPRARGA